MWIQSKSAPNYDVSNLGRIRSNIFKWNKNGRHFWEGKIITQSMSHLDKRKLYLRANLVTDQGTINFNVHRLIAEMFSPEGQSDDRNQVNHKDGNPTNNHFSNLEWVNAQENKDHAIATGLQWYLEGEARKESKLKVKDIEQILYRYFFKFEKLSEISEDFNMLPEYISLIIRGKRWGSVFNSFIEVNSDYHRRVAPILANRKGTNEHLFKSRIEEALEK